MRKKEDIIIDVEKTIESISDYKRFEGNQFLITRINTGIDKQKNENQVLIFKFANYLKLKPLFLISILLLNIFTGIFYYTSTSENTNNNNDNLISLMEEFSLSNDKYDINFLSEIK